MRLIGSDYRPLPPSDVQRRLQQIDPGLFIKWIDGSAQLGLPASWGVCQKWEMNDPRRKRIYAGEISPTDDHDLIVQLPADCTADEAYGYIVNKLRRYHDSDREDFKRLLSRVTEYNKGRQDALFDDVHSEALNMIELRGGRMFENSMGKGTVKVYQSGSREKRATP